jgi:hypothetical protein
MYTWSISQISSMFTYDPDMGINIALKNLLRNVPDQFTLRGKFLPSTSCFLVKKVPLVKFESEGSLNVCPLSSQINNASVKSLDVRLSNNDGDFVFAPMSLFIDNLLNASRINAHPYLVM